MKSKLVILEGLMNAATQLWLYIFVWNVQTLSLEMEIFWLLSVKSSYFETTVRLRPIRYISAKELTDLILDTVHLTRKNTNAF